MMSKTTKVMLITGGVLVLIWLLLLKPSSEGYGYPGYNNFRGSGGGLFYWGSSRPYYHGTSGPGAGTVAGGSSAGTVAGGPSARTGSVGGPKVAGGGMRGGK